MDRRIGNCSAFILAIFLLGAAGSYAANGSFEVLSHISIAPISIPIGATGVTNIGMTRLSFRTAATGEHTSISAITVQAISDGTFSDGWVSAIRVYYEEQGGAGEYDHGAPTGGDVRADTGGPYTFTGGSVVISLNPSIVEFSRPGGADNYLFVVIDLASSANTATNLGCRITNVTYGLPDVGTGSNVAPPALTTKRNLDNYKVTAAATGIAADAAANATNVGVFRLDLSLADSSASASLWSVKVRRLGGADNWVTSNGVLLFVDDGDNVFEPGVGAGLDGAAVATATLGATTPGYATLTVSTSIAVPSGGKAFFVALNMNSVNAVVGQTIGLEVENPSTDIVFVDEIEDDNPLVPAEYAYVPYTAVPYPTLGTYEYNQTAYVDPASTTAIPTAGNTFTVKPPNDGVPPEVAATIPTAGATNVDRDSNITVVFDKYMAESGAGSVTDTANYVLFETLTPANTVSLGLSYSAGTQTLTADPATALAWGTQYTFTVKSTVADYYNVAMGTDYSWSFTVEPARHPVVQSTVPDSSATNVVRDTQVTATFSENVSGVSGSSFKLWEGPVAGVTEVTTVTVSYDNVNWVATMTLNPPPPTTKFKYNTQYWATLNHDLITDSDGLKLADQIIGGTEQDKTWTFYTVPSTPPSVISVTPAEDATGVPIASAIQVVFSKPVDATTLVLPSNNITVQVGGLPVSGTISPSTGNTNTATFTPASPLDYLKTYAVTVNAGVNGVKDTDGTQLSAAKTWSFTTFGFTKATIVNNRLVPGVNSETLIFVPQAGASDRVSVQVFTTTGRLVRTFYKNVAFGSIAVPIRWDGTNDRGKPLGPGMYFVQIVVAGTKQVLKVLIVR
jgi:hypothetical protein